MRKPDRALLVPFLAAIVLSGTIGCARDANVRNESATPHPDLPVGVDNFGIVTAELWRGAKPTRDGMRSLAEMGVQTVIDLQEQDESGDIPAGVRYVPIRTSRWHADRVDTAAVLQAIAESPKPVFIHCEQGRDRTGLAVAAYRIAHGMDPDAAVAELVGFHVNLWWRSPIEKRIRALARVDRPA